MSQQNSHCSQPSNLNPPYNLAGLSVSSCLPGILFSHSEYNQQSRGEAQRRLHFRPLSLCCVYQIHTVHELPLSLTLYITNTSLSVHSVYIVMLTWAWTEWQVICCAILYFWKLPTVEERGEDR